MSINRTFLKSLVLISGMALFTVVLQAAPHEKKATAGSASKADSKTIDADLRLDATISAGISIGDARRLASKHGITGSKPLPPGIKKNLARGKPMPPGIQNTRMPESFIRELPRHEGYEWRQTGTDLVLVASGSLVISDILEGVFD